MDSVLRKITKRENKVAHKKLVKVWVSEKVRPTKQPRMSVMKWNSKSKSKEIRTSRKTMMQMPIKKNKMISKWKEISKETCTPSKNNKKNKANNKKIQKRKWARWTTRRGNRI